MDQPVMLGVNRADTIYDLVGGQDTFLALVNAFYARVETEPLLRPMYPKHLGCAIRALAQFLGQFFGGPMTYTEANGHPRLKQRHSRFKIGQAERDAWLRHMLAAMDDVGIAEPARTPMRRYFEQTSAFLINRPADADAGTSDDGRR